MSHIRYIPHTDLPALLTQLVTSHGRVLVPQKQGNAVIFAPYTAGADFTLDVATVPPKEAVLPQCETLLEYSRVKDSESLARVTLGLTARTTQEGSTIVFGARPCDARGFAVLDRPYMQGPFVDPYYSARREGLIVITRACAVGSGIRQTCFCHWVGSSPVDTAGSDILMTDIETQTGQGFVLTAITPKGETLLAALPLADGTEYKDAALAAQKQAQHAMPAAPDLGGTQESLAERFTDAEFWHNSTQHCLSCGACTYFCPTCYCFNITDEGDGTQDRAGKRLRSWDSCMASHFTREASGHNPRTVKAYRMRNRVSHKFWYYPKIWGVYSCNGCGRCIQQCPVHVDIRTFLR